jgi:hypothetical protein
VFEGRVVHWGPGYWDYSVNRPGENGVGMKKKRCLQMQQGLPELDLLLQQGLQ